MENLPCCHCGDFFPRSPRHKNQNYYMKPECRKAKKAAWRREKMRMDDEFRLGQQLSHQKWLKANPDYWKAYRREHPEKTIRNRYLQVIRNRRRAKKSKEAHASDKCVIAKIDASKSNKFDPVGQY